MKFSIKQENEISIMSVSGSMSQEHVPLFRGRLQDLIEGGTRFIVLDMKDAGYISSMGLAVIVDAQTKLAAKDGTIKLARSNYLIKNLLKITNLCLKIEEYDYIEDAINSFQQ
ncbi:MAG: STAS domain-containing protein [Chitinivibrionales bacterium]|nr:STAS domain-containing protein [Chitinivibrionales bacterium]